MEKKDLQILVGGIAGSGSLTAGTVLGRVFTRMGYYTIGVNEYPSIIRGGHTAYWVRSSTEPVYELEDINDLVIAMDDATIKSHSWEIGEDTIIIYDPGQVKTRPSKGIIFETPLRELIRKYKLSPLSMNIVAAGVAAALLGIPMDYLYQAVEDQFKASRKLIDINKRAATIGYEYASTKPISFDPPRLADPRPWGERIYITGNEAITLGMVKAGVRFYAAYPMTPASSILHYMINISRDKDIIVVQAESEIAAAQMVVGATWTGLRAATGTSGGGFALMNETLSMAGMIEAPMVIILAQRAGPSTGMATMHAQEDLLYSIFAGHGEFPRIVVAPGNQEEIFYRTIEVFNLAEKYRTPAIILLDKYLSESHRSVNAFPEDVVIERGPLLSRKEAEENIRAGWEFKPYERTGTGVSPWVPPGTRGAFVKSDGNEHDEYGYVSIDPSNATAMYYKRLRKTRYILSEIEEKYSPVKRFGDRPEDSDIVILTWGSATLSMLEARKHLVRQGLKISIIQVVYMAPFPVNKFMEVIRGGLDKEIITVEYNATGQLGRLVSLETGVKPRKHIGKVDGRPFRARLLAREILNKISR